MKRRTFLIPTLPLMAWTVVLTAQNPLRHPADAVEARFSTDQPVLRYELEVTPGDTTGFAVTIRIRSPRDTFRLAMPAHPEYDERYWRHVEGLVVSSPAGPATVSRVDSATWRVTATGGEVRVRYRIRIPPPSFVPRAAWRPHLTSTGGLIGGPYGLLYVLGAELSPAHIELSVPEGWDIATGLEPTSDPFVFYAQSAGVLMGSPILVGQFHDWHYAVDGVPHRIAYWPLPDAVGFDSTMVVDGLRRLSEAVVGLFGRAPYREYIFLIEDGAYGALEHANSVTLGAPSAELARDFRDFFGEAAHEYFHAWNLMRIRPVEYAGISPYAIQPSSGLWWSEGLTMFYADLLLRRAGLPTLDSTRIAHLQRLVQRYLSEPGNTHLSPERVSRGTYGGTPEQLGDYQASPHVQGELLGTALDLRILSATGGQRSMDDLMRLMFERFSGPEGFAGSDIEHAAAEVCGCAMNEFFDHHVRGAMPLELGSYLRMIGLQLTVSRVPARSADGRPLPDLRVSAWEPPEGGHPRFLIRDPLGSWGRAGLHTGDELVTMNGAEIPDWNAFRRVLQGLHVGDRVHVVVRRPDGPFETTVVVNQAIQVFATISPLPGVRPEVQALRDRWLQGAP